jgi:hypothetical protein
LDPAITSGGEELPICDEGCTDGYAALREAAFCFVDSRCEPKLVIFCHFGTSALVW